jgi:hypothetical protein
MPASFDDLKRRVLQLSPAEREEMLRALAANPKYPRRIRFGVLKGKIRYPADFDAPLPTRVIASFGGRAAK